MRKRIPVEIRLWARVDKDGPIPDAQPHLGRCWVWTGRREWFGHGTIQVDGQKVKVHRLSWAIEHGPIPDGLCVLHRCDNPPCLRPDHLFLGTKTENARDRDAKGRHHQTVRCPLSHAYIVRPNGRKWCPECTRERNASARSRRRTLIDAIPLAPGA